MCLGQFSPNRSTISMDPPSVRDTDSSLRFTTTLEAMAAQPSWSLRRVFKPQAPVRPGVARKLAGTAKINLNKYWHVLEDLVHVETSFPTKVRADSPREYEDIGMSNEINENLANERYEILAAPSPSTMTMDIDKPPTPPSVQQPALPTALVHAPPMPTSPPSVQQPALPTALVHAPPIPTSPPSVQQPALPSALVHAPPVPTSRSPSASRAEKRERAPKKAVTPKSLTPRPIRSPLALINGNQRKSSTPAKTLSLSVRRSPVTPKSPMTVLAENFQRHLYNHT